MTKQQQTEELILVLGATGKTGHRIVERLNHLNRPVRIGSRSANIPFDWQDSSNWDDVLNGVSAIYINFAPDLAIPGAADKIQTLMALAINKGVKRVVLLSGRGEKEAQHCESIIQSDQIEWTVVRSSWFAQNFSEGLFLNMIMTGEVLLPAGSVKEPFIDIDDIADVAVAALTEHGHNGQIYEVTGPQLLSFTDAVNKIATATGRDIRYRHIPIEDFIATAIASNMPDDLVWLLEYLFTRILDGRNEYLSDGVQRALGREPLSFADYAEKVAKSNTWKVAA